MAKQQIVEYDNGATLIYQKQSSFNGYSFVVGFLGGAQLDGKYKGMSHLLEHLLFRTPTQEKTQALLNNILQYSINQNAYTSRDAICVDFSCTYDNVRFALASVIGNLLNKRKFTPEQIAQEIEIVKHEIAIYKGEDEKDLSAISLLLSQLVESGPKQYGRKEILGNPQTLHQITPEMLKDYVSKYFNLNNLVISVTSNKSLENVQELIETYIFPKLKPARAKKYIIDLPEFTTYKRSNLLCAVPTKHAQNVSICILLRDLISPKVDANIVYAVNTIEEYIINQMGGLLWDRLRVKNQLVYDAYISNAHFDNDSFKCFVALTSVPKMRKTISEICKLIKEIGEHGFPEKNFEIVKRVLTEYNAAKLNKFKSESANSNFNAYVYGEPFIDYKKVDAYIKNMTLEDFNALVAKVYKQAHVSIAVQGNFDSRKMYNLVEIEQMLGNKSHVEDLEEYNPIRMESSDITFTIDLDTLMGALGGGETEAQVAPKNHKKAPAAKRPADIIIDAPSTDDGLEK